MNSKIILDHTRIAELFQEHINPEMNRRILFTGAYGKGKSTFLNHFFNNNKEYFPISLKPVNYSVAANEDVYELIKLDIILEVIGNYSKDVELKDEQFSVLLRSQMFMIERFQFMPWASALLAIGSKLGKTIVPILEAGEKIIKAFKNFKKETDPSETNKLTTYIKRHGKNGGGIYEMDDVSMLIGELLGRIKDLGDSAKEKRKSVLILDDLDRLDPEHIFRLLNVFSSHNIDENQNKFGFDKIIIVCDLENIRSIFHHKYGAETDFAGYIDKFYSFIPFEFDNREEMRDIVDKVLNGVRVEGSVSFLSLNQANSHVRLICAAILNILVEDSQINLRMILNYPTLDIPQIKFGKNKDMTYMTSSSPIAIVFYFLKNIFGSFFILRKKLESIAKNYAAVTYNSNSSSYTYFMTGDNYYPLFTFCMPYLIDDWLREGPDDTKSFIFPKYNCSLYFKGKVPGFSEFYNFEMVKYDNSKAFKPLNPYQILLDTFDELKSLGALK